MVIFNKRSSPINRRNGNAGKITTLLFAATFMLWIDRGNDTYVRNLMDSSSFSITSDSGGKSLSGRAINIQEPVAELAGNHQEVIIPLDERKPESEIRYAAFGSSSTWGASLRDREHSAYVWRLSNFDQERGKNFGIRAGGPSYPASCLYTMVGSNKIDVFILEFYLDSWDGLELLTKRIRQRFPNAIIVLLRIYGVNLIKIGGYGESVKDWAYNHGFRNGFIHDEKFKKEFLKETGADDWKFFTNGEEMFEGYLEKAADNVGAYLLKMPYNERPDGPGGFLEIADRFLADDAYHQSEGGHKWIADQVKAIVDRVGVPKETRVEPFSELDNCFNWLLTGSIDERLKYSANASVIKMPNTEKYALEFDFEKGGEDGSWIEVYNQSTLKMSLAIGYMTTGPSPSKYPKMEAKLPSGRKIILQPESDPNFGEKRVHISRSAKLGKIGPLESIRIFFQPLEESEWPFRLTQVMVTRKHPTPVFNRKFIGTTN